MKRRLREFFLAFSEDIVYTVFTRRCDGMVDVTDSKSVGLIPRVGSSPTTGTKRKPPQRGGFRLYISEAKRIVDKNHVNSAGMARETCDQKLAADGVR